MKRRKKSRIIPLFLSIVLIGCGQANDASTGNLPKSEESVTNIESVQETNSEDTGRVEETKDVVEEVVAEASGDFIDLEAIKAQFPNLKFIDRLTETDVLEYEYQESDPMLDVAKEVAEDYVDSFDDYETPEPDDNFTIYDNGDNHIYDNYRYGYRVAYTEDTFDDYSGEQDTDLFFAGQRNVKDENNKYDDTVISVNGNNHADAEAAGEEIFDYTTVIFVQNLNDDLKDSIIENLSHAHDGESVVLKCDKIGKEQYPCVRIEHMTITLFSKGSRDLDYSRVYLIENPNDGVIDISMGVSKMHTHMTFFDTDMLLKEFQSIADSFEFIETKEYEVPTEGKTSSNTDIADGLYRLISFESKEITAKELKVKNAEFGVRDFDIVDLAYSGVDGTYAISSDVEVWLYDDHWGDLATGISFDDYIAQYIDNTLDISFKNNTVIEIYIYPNE